MSEYAAKTDSSDEHASETDDAHISGHGSPLVLLHGICASWHIWKPVISELGRYHRVIAITLPGHPGGPPLPAGKPVCFQTIRETLVEELDRRGIDKAHFAGNSLGGWVALEMARSGHALSVTALSPAGAWRTQRDQSRLLRMFSFNFAILPLILALLGWAMRFSLVRRLLGGLTMAHPQKMPGDEFRSQLVTMRNTRWLPEYLRNPEINNQVQPMKAQVPTHIAWCEHDKVLPEAEYGEPMYAAISGARRSQLADAGHVPMYDNPPAVVRAILETTGSLDQ